ncbi:MAG TPA: hypothetical protein VFA75_17175 [Nevskia sp.]|nr:hypothetical protein [Nevskia sp.]
MVIAQKLTPALALLLLACGPEYIYTPPPGVEGLACVTQCQAAQADCQAGQRSRAEAAAAQCRVEMAQRSNQCEQVKSAEYASCLGYTRSDAARAACEQDRKRHSCDQPACVAAASFERCDRDYRSCYQACGGQVGVKQ